MRLVTERADPETQVIRVVGDLEWQDASLLADVAVQTAPPPRRRVLDLSEMTFIDSMGMRALLEVENATSAAGGETVLVLGEESYVRRLLEIRGVLDRFRVVATRAQALSRPS
jgi:anti-anti-sigma factor